MYSQVVLAGLDRLATSSLDGRGQELDVSRFVQSDFAISSTGVSGIVCFSKALLGVFIEPLFVEGGFQVFEGQREVKDFNVCDG